ncbi:hypothetical protein EON80_15125 [bacterium]|nr:MAG: hypothetical protein EON80_15125 [bacterium]
MNTSSNTVISLESIQIATPCRADWDKMSGNGKSRFCGSSAKHVSTLSAMTNGEASSPQAERPFQWVNFRLR